MAVASVVVILLMIAFALAAPLIAHLTGHPVDQAYANTGEDASGLPVGPGVHGFSLGTDGIGRDLLVRIALRRAHLAVRRPADHRAGDDRRVSLGLVAGYFGGVVDAILARFIDAALAFPFIILALALAVGVRPEPDAS